MKQAKLVQALLSALLIASCLPGALAVTPEPSAAVPLSSTKGAHAQVEDGDDNGGPPSLFEAPVNDPLSKANLVVRISTPHNLQAQDAFTLYPYPPKPPGATPSPMLPFRGKSLSQLVLCTGYLMRPDLSKPYPMGGWRWIYCYKEALKKSALKEPRTLVAANQWTEEICPYVAHECIVRNQFEKERWQRYLKAVDEYNRHHVDYENEAVRLGLSPIVLSHRIWSMGKAQFAAGSWWLQVTRKTPGLVYYWLQPITAAGGQQIDVVLDENNALFITGAW